MGLCYLLILTFQDLFCVNNIMIGISPIKDDGKGKIFK